MRNLEPNLVKEKTAEEDGDKLKNDENQDNDKVTFFPDYSKRLYHILMKQLIFI